MHKKLLARRSSIGLFSFLSVVLAACGAVDLHGQAIVTPSPTPPFEKPDIITVVATDKVIPSPDNGNELIVRGEGPGVPDTPSGEEEAYVCMGSQSGGADGQVSFTFTGIGSHSAVDGFWSPDSRHLGIIVRHTKLHDLMVVSRAVTRLSATSNLAAVTFASVKIPPLPAGGIIDKFPTTGKPAGRKFGLDSLSITRAVWSQDGTQLAIQATIKLKDLPGSGPGPGYHYVVDYVVTMPVLPATFRDGGEATLDVKNIAFLEDGK